MTQHPAIEAQQTSGGAPGASSLRGRTMSLYHLDPRQAGTGATPDVQVAQDLPFATPENGCWKYRAKSSYAMWSIDYPTEQAALAAARVAADFGHVAERACEAFACANLRAQDAQFHDVPERDSAYCSGHECAHCAWPHSAQ